MGKRIDICLTETGIQVSDRNGCVVVRFYEVPARQWRELELSAYSAQLLSDAIAEARSDALGSGLIARATVKEATTVMRETAQAVEHALQDEGDDAA